jgi:hypothetical protein
MQLEAQQLAQYDPRIEELWRVTEGARQEVLSHPIYTSLNTIDALRAFMETHIFAVWDFMSLLKSLQQSLTCVSVPWLPTGSTKVRRLINEIVMGEESDCLERGYASHFELYLTAMADAGADSRPVLAFLSLLRSGQEPKKALRGAGVPPAAAEFVSKTWRVIEEEPLHCQAAAFAFSREDLIPEMFEQVLSADEPRGQLKTFRFYLERHIEIDGGDHGPMTMAMVTELCGNDPLKWEACADVVNRSLKARAAMWTGVLDSAALLPAKAG